jgi:hypothetical protein
MNWIHEAASTLSDSASCKVSRVKSTRLTLRGLGCMSRSASGCVLSIGT